MGVGLLVNKQSKASNVKMSVWALGTSDGHFSQFVSHLQIKHSWC